MTRPTLWILDITAMAFRAMFAAPPLTNSRGVPTGGAYLFTRMLLKLLDEKKPTHCCAVWDAPTRSFRKELSPDYKAHRQPLPPEFKSQLKLCRAVVKALPLPVLQVPGVEADDAIASLAREVVDHDMDAIVSSPDKDLQVLVGAGSVHTTAGVRVYDPVKEIFYTAESVTERWGVPPAQISDLLALVGDASDNVSGVKGVGEKTASAWLRAYGDLAGVIANAGEVKGKRGLDLRTAIEDGSLELCRKLTALRYDVPVEDPRAMVTPPPDERAREFLFRHLEFFSLLPSDQLPSVEELDRRQAYDATGRRAP